jgi:cyanophycin synthetase
MNTKGPVGLRLQWVDEFHGPNPHAAVAVVVGVIKAQALPDCKIMWQITSDLWALSGMDRTQAEEARNGGEVDSLLMLAKTAAAWALASLNEVRGFLAHAGAERNGDNVRLWLGFHHAQISRDAMQLALNSILKLLKGELDRTQLKTDLDRLWKACRNHHPDYQARILMVGAREMDVPCLLFMPGTRFWQYGWGSKARVFMETLSNQNGSLGQQWQKNKVIAKGMMKALGLPTPEHMLVLNEDQIQLAVARLGFPCVFKPLDSGGGKGVTANVRSIDDALSAFRVAHQENQGPVLVEKHVQGNDHRLMIIDGQFVAAIRREPSFVVGDGKRSVAALVSRLNANRSSNMVRSRYLRPIALDGVLERHLATQSLSLNDVLPLGKRVTLRSNANLSTGGICTDMTSSCHPQIRAMAVLLAKSAGLATTGIDYLTNDITRPAAETGGEFIEMNATPGLPVCVVAGWSEAAIARRVLGDSIGRIPVDITILSSAGIKKLLEDVDTFRFLENEALVIGDEIHVGVASMHIETEEPWAAVRAGLRNAMVDSMHVICSVSELKSLGCPVDIARLITIEIGEVNESLSPDWVEVLDGCSESRLVYLNECEIRERFKTKKT